MPAKSVAESGVRRSAVELRLRRLRLLLNLGRSQNQVQGVPFLPRHILDHGLVRNVFDQPLQDLTTEHLAGHFTSAEKDGCLYLVTVTQET